MPNIKLKHDENGNVTITPEKSITRVSIENIGKIKSCYTEHDGESVSHNFIFLDGSKATYTITNDGKFSFKGLGPEGENFKFKIDNDYALLIGLEQLFMK